jgi:hypothetical protein
MLGESLVTKSQRVHRLQMEGRPQAIVGTCEYFE